MNDRPELWQELKMLIGDVPWNAAMTGLLDTSAT